MSSNLIQTSFSSGELAPSLFARVDLTKYHTGAATLRNFFCDYRSGASTRPGTKFCNQAFKSSTPVRVIPFQSSLLVPYILEFGDGYVRFFSFGSPVLEAPFAITGATQANPCVLTVTGNNFVTGDWIFVTGIVGMTQLNGRYFRVTVSGASVTLADTNGVPINSLSFTAWSSGGTAARVYTLASPYAAADLALLKFVQLTNTMYITHPSYAPRTLTLTTPTSWAFASITFATTISAPTGLSASASSAGSTNYAYVVTSVDVNGQESVPSAVVNLAGAVNVGATAGTISIGWTAATGAIAYNVYKAEISFTAAIPAGAAFGFIGSTAGVSFIDSNIVPDFSSTPPIANNPFVGGGNNNPGTCCFFQQRLYLAATNNNPQTFFASQPGIYNNFNISDPTQADDSIEGTLVSKQVNTIRNMLPMPGGLIMFTAQGAWQVSSGSGVASTSAVTPINVTANPQSYNGSTDLPPFAVNWDVLYCQSDGAVIDLKYNIYAAIYTGDDISVLSNHLFFGYTLREWAYAQRPFKIVWAVRNDGVLLSLTYVKEQEMIGWARHDTLGSFKSVASVTEGNYDATYAVVQRTINGFTNQFVERFDDRVALPYGVEDAWAVDCGIKTVLPTPAAGLTISASTGTGTFTADSPVFGTAAPGDVLRAGGGVATISSVVTSSVVTATITQPITAVVPNDPAKTPLPVASGDWTLARPSTVFTGLDYLNGMTVQILADGNVQAPQVVVAGAITLLQPATKVIAGLGFQKQLKTMPLDLGNEKDTVQGKFKKISAVSIRVVNTRGLKFGNSFDHMFPIKEMTQNVPMGNPIPLVTGDERVIWDPAWTVPGQMCFQSDDPLPATILGVIPEITIGSTPSKT
ncbi:MAG: hypothetical protein LAO23_19700 [Acidobacteriia bacterium]|nr:hypothetical protein [Terriglobia bacterium]